MLKNITDFQRVLCEPCEYRRKELETIVMCPLVNNCPKIKPNIKKRNDVNGCDRKRS